MTAASLPPAPPRATPLHGARPHAEVSHPAGVSAPAHDVRAPEVASRPIPGGDKSWEYLVTPAYQTRYVLAAHYLDACADVVEVGGYRTPISGFLRAPHRSVTVIDPLIEPGEHDMLAGQPCRVRHVRAFFQDVPDLPATYGLALLGFDLELYEVSRVQRRRTLDQLTPVVRAASRIVMEIPRDWAASRWLGAWVEKTTGFRRVLDVTLDLKPERPEDLGVDLATSWPPIWRRRVLVLDP
jgi:hypothetical protein